MAKHRPLYQRRPFLSGFLALLGLVVLNAPLMAADSIGFYFAKAKHAYQVGDVQTASRLLTVIIKHEPSFAPGYALLGRIYYEEGNVVTAAHAFRHADMGAADELTTFEAGLAFFATKDCTRALDAFGHVARSSRRANVASFYAGVCLYRRQQYHAAQVALRRATNLPAALASTRRRLLISLQQQYTSPSSAAPSPFAYSAPYEPLPSYAPPPFSPGVAEPNTAGAIKDTGKKSEDSAKKTPHSGASYTFTPSAAYLQSNTHSNYYGAATNDLDLQIYSALLNGQFRYDGQSRAIGQPAMTLGLTGSSTMKSLSSTHLDYYVLNTDPSNVLIDTSAKGSATRIDELSGKPGGELAVGKQFTLGLDYQFDWSNLSGGASGTNIKQGPEAQVSYSPENWVLGLSANMITVDVSPPPATANGGHGDTATRVDANLSRNGEITTLAADVSYVSFSSPAAGGDWDSTLVAMGSLAFNFDIIDITAKVTSTQNTPPSGAAVESAKFGSTGLINGAQSSTNYDLQLQRTFEFGAAISLDGFYNQFNIYRISGVSVSTNGDNQIASIATNGSSKGILATFTIAPLDWLSGVAKFNYTKNDYQLPQGPYLQAFESKVAETSEMFSLSLEVKKSL